MSHANRNWNKKQALEKEVKEIYAKGTFAAVDATATLNLTADIVLTDASNVGTARNDATFTVEVEAAASNAGDAALVTFTGTSAAVTCTVTPHTGDVASVVWNLTNDITISTEAVGTSRNTNTITLDVAAAAANPTNTVLVDVTGTSAATTITVTPNDGTNNAATPVDLTTAQLAAVINAGVSGTYTGVAVTVTDAGSLLTGLAATGGGATALAKDGEGDGQVATATFNLTDDVIVTTEAEGATRNTNTITLQVLAAAANPTNTVLVAVTGTSAATTITVTPNDGTNNTATPVDLTTAQLAAVINAGVSGTYTGTVVTVTDAGNLLSGLAATGGGATALVDAGEGDGVVATFADGQDVVTGALSGGSAAQSVTTANLVELINTGAIAGKTVTLTDASSLRALQTATGGGVTPLADAGEGDGVEGTFAGGDFDVTFTAKYGISDIVCTGVGEYRIDLEDKWYSLKGAKMIFLKSTGEDLRMQLKSESVTSSTLTFLTIASATPTDPSDGLAFLLRLDLKNTNIV